MWTWLGSHGYSDSFGCLSTDEKPTEGIKNASDVIEIDTGNVLFFDATSGQWLDTFGGG